MREIEFRGKGINEFDNIWCYGDLLSNTPDGRCFIQIKDYMKNPIEINKETIGQYTGIKDKNGKKIFEGDVVSFGRCSPKNIVSFGQHSIACCGCCYDRHETIGFYFSDYNEDEETFDNIEVIGNIWDNPELTLKN